MERIIEQTADGSATLYIPEMDEHYHSVKGALTESQHIFVGMGFNYSTVDEPRILEIGFGTGLNAYLTLKAAEGTNRIVHYTGIEKYPLPWNIVNKLGYTDDVLFHDIHNSLWNREVAVRPGFVLTKIETDFQDYTPEKGYDIVYFDAFAPEKQPVMWEKRGFMRLYENMNPGGILTTYCSKGAIRRMLQQTGFTVERLPGPPGGKREILRATKQSTTKKQ